jgi:hypothetical protein
MNRHHIKIIQLVTLVLMFGVSGCQQDPDSPEAILKNVDAKQAIAIANEWKWSKKDIKSSVTSRDIIFELSKKKVKRFSLPDDKMMVAIAPYINQTHQ